MSISPMALVLKSGFFIGQLKPWRNAARWRQRSSCQCSAIATLSTDALENPLQLLDSSQSNLVKVYIETLLDWNQRMNLVSALDKNDMMERHIGDSLALLPVIEKHCKDSSEKNMKLVDVGSGAGLPGIVFGIARPDWEVTLVEATSKKCDFLDNVVDAVGLKNVCVIRGRAEDIGQDVRFRESFNIAVARGVARMRVLAELCLPLLEVGGVLIAAKGANSQEEAEEAQRALSVLGGSLVSVCQVASESIHGTRTAIVCSKLSSTPKKYPRPPGTPAKSPIEAFRANQRLLSPDGQQ